MRNFKIVMTGPGRGEVFMDGEKVEGVRAVSFSAEVGESNSVILTFNAAAVEVEGLADVTTIGDDCRQFAKAS